MNRRSLLKSASGIILASGAASAQAAEGPLANTEYGTVRGRTEKGVERYLGIRYGADTAPRRFMPPVKPEGWDGIREVAAYGPACPQRSGERNQSEDCLFLNVWTRKSGFGRGRPVLVYFHGGAYATGSGSDPLYDGTNLVRRGDVVVVTVNHRLGVLGYGYFARLGAPDSWLDSGNAGQLDLILALEWVRDNIAAFGGDPGNVTVFGQSGGGAKIATLMAMPAAKGLFHKAWTMSGQQVTASGPGNATKRAEAFLDALGIPSSEVASLGTLPVEKLISVLRTEDPVLEGKTLYFGPTLDMRSLPRHPFYPDAPSQSHDIPMVLGNTKDETRAFLGNDPRNFELTWEELPKALAPQLVVDIPTEHVVARYREIYPKMTPSQVFFAATTAGRSWRGQVEEADRRAEAGAPTWVYQLNWETPKDGGKWGAPHTLDIPLVFDNTEVAGSLSGDGREARKVSALMAETLIGFAETGVPQSRLIPDWPTYRLPERRTLVIDLPPKVVADPRKSERELFAAVPYVQPGS